MTALFSSNRLRLIQALIPVLERTPWWERRHEVEWYVNRCEMAGFCDTDDMRRLCAQRYMAGKRKVTPPGTQRRKVAERERRRLLRAMPIALTEAIAVAAESTAAQQFATGNDKALNAVVGMVLKKYKAEPAFVRELLAARLRPNALGEGRERGILREASSGEAATSTVVLGADRPGKD